MKKYITTKEECEKSIRGVCGGCGGTLEPIETVDNSGNPTYWIGCNHCQCFRGGVEEKHFKIARKLIENNEMMPYGHMDKGEYEETPEQLEYYFATQTAGLSCMIARIDFLLKEE